MKTALVTTTINVPRVLELYRASDPDVMFFIAADEKTPREAYEFCANIPNCEIYSPDRQRELNYACSELIGWNSIQRRNIATLEALKWGADVIVSVDDDNIPIESLQDSYFKSMHYVVESSSNLDTEWYGIKASASSASSGWFDVGQLLDPVSPHRGFPHTKKAEPSFSHVVNAKIGVAAGICLGDPDISAVTRIANAPTVHRVSELLRAGIVVDPKETWTVFNSQNTAIIRELAPAFFMLPGVGRYDDILASLIVQRIAAERGYHIHFGQPFVWQQRNEHNLVRDLRAEIDGMEKIVGIAARLEDCAFASGSTIIEQLAEIWNAFDRSCNLSRLTVDCAAAWLEDCEKVL